MFQGLLNTMRKQVDGDPFGHHAPSAQRPEIDQGRAQAQEETADEAKSNGEDAADGKGSGGDGDDSQAGGKSDGDSDDDDADADGGLDGDDEDGDGPGDEDGDTGGGMTAGKSSDEGEGDQSDEKGGGKGVGHGNAKAPRPVSDDDFARILEDAKGEADSSESVQEDAKSKQDVIVQGDREAPSRLDMSSYASVGVSGELLAVTRKFGKELQRLRDEVDPGWHREKASGRLNVQRAMRGDDIDTIFDQWDEGKTDAADVEAVVLLDYSGSMAAMMDEASKSMWAIKRSLEAINGKVTVIGYSDTAVLMYDAQSRVDRIHYKRFASAGGTYPAPALEEAALILHKSSRKTKFLISITDGAWGGTRSVHEETIKRFNAAGVVTAMLYLIAPYFADRPDQLKKVTGGINWQGHTVRAAMLGAANLAPFAVDLVKARLAQPVR